MDHVADAPSGDRYHTGHRGGVCWIVEGNQTTTAGLTSDRCRCRVSVAGCVCSRLSTIAAGATVDVTDFDAAVAIEGHVIEVEHIAADVGVTVHKDAARLIWRVLRCICC